MKFNGIQVRFNCENNEQYENIGLFWEYMTHEFKQFKLQGVGYNWYNNSFDYIIGNCNKNIDFSIAKINKRFPSAKQIEINLPDEGWQIYYCKLEELGKIYDEIYKDGPLDYEIEEFDSNGNCKISILRIGHDYR
jgi:predicted transcriptional regulator YdeE